jgi:hypothetical protein
VADDDTDTGVDGETPAAPVIPANAANAMNATAHKARILAGNPSAPFVSEAVILEST